MKKLFLFFLFFFFATLLTAHEFWLAPDKYFYNIRDIATIRFYTGENFSGKNWSGNKEKITRLTHFVPNGNMVDLSDKLSMNKGDSIRVPLQTEGTHMVIFNSTNSHIELDAEQFNAYLKEDGLETALEYRKKNGTDHTKGKEYYQRSVKTIIQVGNERTNDCTQPTGLPLEIIPFENPYASPGMAPQDNLPRVRFRVLFKGKPLTNCLLKTWYRDAKGNPQMEQYRTNNRGIVHTKRYSGPFMVTTVYMERITGDDKADWQSYWSSLNFEFSSFFPSGR